MDIPREAWEEAEGRSIYLQYRRYATNRYVLRVARCVVPASMVAVEHLFDRFGDSNSAHVHGTAADFRSELAIWDWDECQNLKESVEESEDQDLPSRGDGEAPHPHAGEGEIGIFFPADS